MQAVVLRWAPQEGEFTACNVAGGPGSGYNTKQYKHASRTAHRYREPWLATALRPQGEPDLVSCGYQIRFHQTLYVDAICTPANSNVA